MTKEEGGREGCLSYPSFNDSNPSLRWQFISPSVSNKQQPKKEGRRGVFPTPPSITGTPLCAGNSSVLPFLTSSYRVWYLPRNCLIGSHVCFGKDPGGGVKDHQTWSASRLGKRVNVRVSLLSLYIKHLHNEQRRHGQFEPVKRGALPFCTQLVALLRK